MSISFRCPECGAALSAPDDYAGGSAKCRNCKTPLKGVDPAKWSSFLPADTPGLAGDYSKQTWTNVTGGTEFWKKLNWKGLLLILSVPVAALLLVLLWLLLI